MSKDPEIARPPARATALMRRLAASAYDWLIVVGILMITSLLLVIVRGNAAIPPGNLAFQAFLGLQVAAFFIGFWWHGGQTPGMRTWRLQVQGPDGAPPGLAAAALRFIAALLSVAALGLGFWWMLLDRHGLTWHDRISGTRLVAAR